MIMKDIKKLNTKEKMTDKELGLFLNWFIKHYNTSSDDLSDFMYYTNVNDEEVSIAEILEHYNKER